MNEDPSDWDELADTNAAEPSDWDDTADTNPVASLPPTSSPNIPTVFVPGAADAFGPAAVLTAPGEVVLRGRGCEYAPATTLRFVPLENGVEVWTTTPFERGELQLTLEQSEWEDWLQRIVSALAEEAQPYPAPRRSELSMTSGSRGGIGVDLPCAGGGISYAEDGARTDRPVRVASIVLELLAEHEIVLDPMHVPD